jgi:hypothetical protein
MNDPSSQERKLQKEKARLEKKLARGELARREGLLAYGKLFYAIVGQGISNWSNMEEQLIEVAAHLLHTSKPKAGLVMYSIINFNVWLQLIDDLFVIDGAFPNSLKQWRQIFEALRNEKDIRDRLAHHRVVQKGYEVHLRPPRADTRTKSLKMQPLTADEILDFSERVVAIKKRLSILLETMAKPQSLR